MAVNLNLWKNFLDSTIATDDYSRSLDAHVMHTRERLLLPDPEFLGELMLFVHQQ